MPAMMEAAMPRITVVTNAENEGPAARLLGEAVTRLKRMARVFLPGGTRRRQVIIRLVDRSEAAENRAFQRWITEIEPGLAAPVVDATGGPLISVVVPTYNTPDRYLVPLVDSVLAQTYPRWELCLADGSTDHERASAIAAQAGRDGRIRLHRLASNLGIAGNTNAGIDQARGDYIAFCDHDDTLAPFALNEVAAVLRADPAIDLFYSDEDKLSEDGTTRSHPFFKVGWSPALFLYGNYLAHFVVARAELVRKVGGIRTGYEGAQDYDFILRTLDHDPRVAHIPRFSYHWRFADGSTARGARQKKGAGDAGCRALGDYLARNGIAARVERIPDYPTNYRLVFEPAPPPAIHAVGAELPGAGRLSSLDALGGLPVGDVLVVLAPGAAPLQPLHPSTVEELAAVAVQPGTGTVTPALLDAAGRSAGIGYGARDGRLWPLFAGERWSRFTRASQVAWPRNLLAAGGCAAIGVGLARELLGAGASLDPVSLSLAAHRRGLRNVYWPFARLRTEDRLAPVELAEPVEDPYLNPNLAPGASTLS
jgi:glycosyltransferase involved in cell wall biosynthesis